MSNNEIRPGNFAVIIYESEILPVEIKKVVTNEDKEGSQTFCVVIDSPLIDGRVLGWDGLNLRMEQVFKDEEDLTNHLKSEYQRKYAKAILE